MKRNYSVHITSFSENAPLWFVTIFKNVKNKGKETCVQWLLVTKNGQIICKDIHCGGNGNAVYLSESLHNTKVKNHYFFIN